MKVISLNLNVERGMLVGARQADLSLSETTDMLASAGLGLAFMQF